MRIMRAAKIYFSLNEKAALLNLFMKSRYYSYDEENEYLTEDDYDDDNIPEIDLMTNSYYLDDFSEEYPD